MLGTQGFKGEEQDIKFLRFAIGCWPGLNFSNRMQVRELVRYVKRRDARIGDIEREDEKQRSIRRQEAAARLAAEAASGAHKEEQRVPPPPRERDKHHEAELERLMRESVAEEAERKERKKAAKAMRAAKRRGGVGIGRGAGGIANGVQGEIRSLVTEGGEKMAGCDRGRVSGDVNNEEGEFGGNATERGDKAEREGRVCEARVDEQGRNERVGYGNVEEEEKEEEDDDEDEGDEQARQVESEMGGPGSVIGSSLESMSALSAALGEGGNGHGKERGWRGGISETVGTSQHAVEENSVEREGGDKNDGKDGNSKMEGGGKKIGAAKLKRMKRAAKLAAAADAITDCGASPKVPGQYNVLNLGLVNPWIGEGASDAVAAAVAAAASTAEKGGRGRDQW